MCRLSSLFSFFFTLLVSFTFAQDKDKKKWDVANPEGDWNFKEMPLSTDEGTWMNLDVSPDGSQIVFDLLGDIYIMSSSGGEATALRSGLPYEVQPRFSPDGKTISFTSDAGGGDNIWTMSADGSNAKQITSESFRLLNNSTWTPDGKYIIARKHFTSTRSLGAGEMWMYHLKGKGGLQITKRKNDQQDVNEPCISPDGKWLYYSEDVYPGGFFQYNKDPNKQIYVINRKNLITGKIERITGGPGGASSPQLSRDGSKFAFIKRVRTKTVLFIHDLKTGEEWPVYDELNKDQQEAWAIFGVYPDYNWTPDDQNIIIWSGGKINRINVNTLEITNIPFQVNNTIKIAKTLEVDTPVFTENLTSKVIRQAVTSPDGKSLVFHALGKLWVKKLPNGKPKRLTDNSDFEFEPTFSPDGRTIAFVTWNDENLGAIHKVSIDGKNSVKLTSENGNYRMPSFSNDGKQIVYKKDGGNSDQGRTFTKKTGLYIINSDGSGRTNLKVNGDYPMFNQKDSRVYFQTGGTYFGSLTKQLKSVDISGNKEITHVKSKHANRLVPSPDNNWIAFQHLHKVYIAPMPKIGNTIDLNDKSKFVPVSQLSQDAGINLHWSGNSKKLHWTLGDEYFSTSISEDKNEIVKNGIKVGLEYKADKPKGGLAFTNARIITMEGDNVIAKGTIIIKENKIDAIGNTGEVSIPSNATVYDVAGKTIMPGIVDAHAHVGGFRYGLITQKHWPFYANLAFGVTTSHDPSANTETIFTLAELVKSGEMVGPRLYSTGFILYGADGDSKAVVNSLDDARSSIRRTKAFGALSVKSYNQPRREQRQQVMQAAREEGIFVVPEGGSTFYHNMSMIMDGHTGIEHNIPIAPVYKDVIELWSNSNSGYTPTLVVNYAGMSGEYYWYQTTNVWENEKLLKYFPRSVIDSRSRHRTMIPMEEYENGHILTAKVCKELTDKGVKVNIGAHGQLQGLAAHWELWMLEQGGMTNMEALRAATMNGAEYLGMSNDIGSLKTGKLADLIVIDGNPLDNIQDSQNVIYTMVNGRLYDTETMNEIGNNPSERGKFYWENNKYNQAFPWHEESNSFMRPSCGCTSSHN